MKSLTIRSFILCSITILLFLSSFSQSTNKNSNTNNQVNLRSPIIDTNRKIGGKDKNFEKVVYVKEISAAGKAALELRNSGE